MKHEHSSVVVQSFKFCGEVKIVLSYCGWKTGLWVIDLSVNEYCHPPEQRVLSSGGSKIHYGLNKIRFH